MQESIADERINYPTARSPVDYFMPSWIILWKGYSSGSLSYHLHRVVCHLFLSLLTPCSKFSVVSGDISCHERWETKIALQSAMAAHRSILSMYSIDRQVLLTCDGDKLVRTGFVFGWALSAEEWRVSAWPPEGSSLARLFNICAKRDDAGSRGVRRPTL